MKEVNQLIHQTRSLKNLKSILKNGLFTSYALERFTKKDLLIPMISFSNIQFRDIGEMEVVDYGSYGIVIEREVGIEYQLNPVLYVYENSQIEEAINFNFISSVILQILPEIKSFYKQCDCKNITNHIGFKPLPVEVKDLLNSINKDTDDKLIDSIKEIFKKVLDNSYRQMLLAKPYKVQSKKGKIFIAYNEREWRKSFFDLGFIYKKTPKGKSNSEFEKWNNKLKPHLTESKYTLQIPIEKIKYIVVENYEEIEQIKEYIIGVYGSIPSNLTINTLNNFQQKEINM